MARIKGIGSHSVDLGSLDLSRVFSAVWFTTQSKLFRATAGDGDFDEFRGEKFDYDRDGALKGGTVTAYAAIEADGDRLLVVEDLKVSAKSLTKAARTYSTADDMQLFVQALKGDDTISGGQSWDVLSGFLGHDKLYGDAGDDKIYAGAGNDEANGDSGLDWLYGEDGKDRLNGGSGNDKLFGGAGRDVFVFNSGLNAKTNVDAVADFSHADDVFHLSADVFKGLFKGGLAEKRFQEVADASSDKAIDRGDRILYDRKDGDLFFDRDGSGDRYEAVKFAEVKNNTSVDHTDFLVV